MTGLSTAEGSGEAAAKPQPAPNPPQLTIDEHGDHLVTVKVEGKTETMRLRDALQGVAHQRKVTQLSQDLRKYEAFFTELEKNPDYVIGQLQSQFGVEGQQEPSNPEETPQVEPENDQLAAMAARIEELSGMLEAQAKQQAQDTEMARVERDLQELQQQFGDAFDRQAVLAYAVDNGISNVKIAFQSWRFENQSQTPEAGNVAAADKAQVLDAIAPGGPTATPAAPVPTDEPAKTPMDAILRAAGQLEDGNPWRDALLGAPS